MKIILFTLLTLSAFLLSLHPSVANERPVRLFPEQTPVNTEPTPNQLATPAQSQSTENAPPPTQDGQQVPNGTDPTQFNVPSIVDANKYLTVTGGQASFIDPSIELNNGAAYHQSQLNVNTLIQNVQSIPYKQKDNLADTSHSLDGQIERVEAARQSSTAAWDKYYKTRNAVIEKKKYNRQADLSLTPKIPTIDGDVSSNGLASELGKSIQDTFDSKRVHNKVDFNDITDFLFRYAANVLNQWWEFIENLGDKDGFHFDNWLLNLPLVSAGAVLNPLGQYQEATNPNSQFLSSYEKIIYDKNLGKIGINKYPDTVEIVNYNFSYIYVKIHYPKKCDIQSIAIYNIDENGVEQDPSVGQSYAPIEASTAKTIQLFRYSQDTNLGKISHIENICIDKLN